MKEIKDINFGIKTWYLQPTFIVKILSILLSAVLLIVIFVISSKFSDKLWKSQVGKSQIIISTILFLTLILTVIFYLFYFYKIFPSYSIHCFFISLASSVLYFIFLIIFIISFGRNSRKDKLIQKVWNFIKNERNKNNCQKWFIDKYCKNMLKQAVNEYVNERTVKCTKTLLVISIVWLMVIAVLFFITIFESGKYEEQNISETLDLIL